MGVGSTEKGDEPLLRSGGVPKIRGVAPWGMLLPLGYALGVEHS